MRLMILIWIPVLMLLSGCNQNNEALLKKYTPPEDEASATNYIALLRQGEFERIQHDTDPAITNTGTHDVLAGMAALIPLQEPVSIKIVGAQQFKSDDAYKINLSFEYQFPTNWLLINVALQRKAGVATILGFHVRPIPDSLENLNRFDLAGKNIFQYVILALAVIIPVFIVYALVLCVRAGPVKRKWLWIIFIIFGIGNITVNWTSGDWQSHLLWVQLLGVGAFAPLYGAWSITIAVPLGAILFVLNRKKLTAPSETKEATAP